jgi:antitoxin CptB
MTQVSLTHLRWMCRRGMLELDFLFERFVDRDYLTLSENNQVLFHEMLNEDDPTLFAWLMGHEVPDERFQQLVATIRQSS